MDYEDVAGTEDELVWLEIRMVHLQDVYMEFLEELDAVNEMLQLIMTSPADRQRWEEHGLDVAEKYAKMLQRRADHCIAELQICKARRERLPGSIKIEFPPQMASFASLF